MALSVTLTQESILSLDGQTGNFNIEPEQPYHDTACAAASTADNSALATTNASVMTGSSVTPWRGPETGVPQATSMENKISDYATVIIGGGCSSRVQQTAMQTTTAANSVLKFYIRRHTILSRKKYFEYHVGPWI